MIDALTGVLAIPAVAAAVLAALPGYRLTARINVLAAFLSFATAASLFVVEPQSGPYLLVDDLNKVFIVLTTFIGFTTAMFSASYIGHEIRIGRLTPTFVRFYHAMYQTLMFSLSLALVANNIGLMWVAIEIATLTTVLMVGIYRTHEALEAAWKYFILGSVGIALALFGTILVYMAARPVIGEGLYAMVWTVLVTKAAKFDPALLNVAFVFLLLGYGTKVGLAPLHAWLPDAHAEGPTPISAVLSGLLLNVALYALLRFKMLLALNPAAIAPGPLMVTMGLISCVFAAFMLYRRRDIKRMFAYSSIEHMGIIVFAFGMRVGQPGMQRRQADLGTVTEQQENEGDVEQSRIELGRARHQHGPYHGVEAFADYRPRRHVDQNGAKQCQRNADAAENEIFPGCLQRFMGAINADHQHGGECGEFDRHPHQADIIGD
jgi:hydrogenase-4 component F